MRLAMVSPGFAPDTGGVESVVTALTEGLVEQGVDVEVWTHAAPGTRCGSSSHGEVFVRRFTVTPSPSGRFSLSPRLWRYARRHAGSFDLIHAHSFHSSAPIAGLAADRTVPFVFSPHYHGVGHTLLARALHLPYAAIGHRLFARADRVIAVSGAEQRLLAEHGRAANATVVHNAVDVAALHAAQPFGDEPPTVLVLGRLEPYKRVDQVIQAFDTQASPGQLVIVGDGPHREQLQLMARRAGRSTDIRVLGRLPRDDVDRWLRTARCVVSMSEHEAFGIVGVEAAAAGAIALLSDLPAHREVAELIGDHAVTVVAPHDLAERIAAALRVRPGVPRTVRNWSDVVSDHLDVYASVLRETPADHQRR